MLSFAFKNDIMKQFLACDMQSRKGQLLTEAEMNNSVPVIKTNKQKPSTRFNVSKHQILVSGRSLIKKPLLSNAVNHWETLGKHRSENTAPLDVINPFTAKPDRFVNAIRI